MRQAFRLRPSAVEKVNPIDVSIAIVNWNALPFLSELFHSLYDSSAAASFEALMVDNASHDGSVELVRQHFPKVRILSNGHNAGFAKATNQAIKASHSRYVLLLNPDTKLAPGSIDSLVQFLDQHSNAAVVGPAMLNADGDVLESYSHFPGARLFLRMAGLLITDRFVHRKLPGRGARRVDWVGGACMLVRRQALEEVGLLDEDFFMYWEEADLCFRLHRAGWQTYYLPQAEVVHYVGGCSAQITDQVQLHGLLFGQWMRSALRFTRKHYYWWMRWPMIAFAAAWAVFAIGLWSIAFTLLPGKRQEARLLIRAISHALVCIPRER